MRVCLIVISGQQKVQQHRMLQKETQSHPEGRSRPKVFIMTFKKYLGDNCVVAVEVTLRVS